MDDFQDWFMSLPEEPLTPDLKVEILSQVAKAINNDLIAYLRNVHEK